MTSLQGISEQVARALLTIGAVALRPNEPFTWTSGMKSPIYCDCRLTISYPDIREQIAEGFAAIIRENYPEVELIAGAATGGIPHAAWVAQKLQLPMIYVREKPKGHGKGNSIEGVLQANQKTVVIEDLISTGGSSLKVALGVQEAGGQVLSVLAITTYQLTQAADAFAEHQIPLQTLTNFTALLHEAVQLGQIAKADIALMQSWRERPEQYGSNV